MNCFLWQLFLISHLCLGLAPPRPACMTSNEARFPHIHPDIVAILEFTSSYNGLYGAVGCDVELVDSETLKILPTETLDEASNDPTPVSTQTLVDLAYTSDSALYRNINTMEESPVIQSLAKMGEAGDHFTVAAALIALKRLESAIRSATGYTAGRAPLLKHMVIQLSDKSIGSILMTLLLPHGLNLRNLLWHGFCAENLPRRWLSLVLVLTYNLESNEIESEYEMKNNDDITSLRNMLEESSVRTLLENKRSDSESLEIIKRWLPKSHHGLLDLAFVWKNTRPASSLAILSIIHEHGLRLDWCRLNDAPENAIARPGAYYVTLDGHGQKHQHDLILYPYVGSGRENKLIEYLGGGTVALLTDLFASSCGGPNIRAALAHGLWDATLELELIVEAGANEEATNYDDDLKKMVNLVIIAMEGAAQSPLPAVRLYRPLFSFRATTLRNIETVVNQLQRLDSLRATQLMSTVTMIENDNIASLNVTDSFDIASASVLDSLRISDDGYWRAEHVFKEHGVNAVLTEFGASRSLLEDLGEVTSSFASALEEALAELQSDNTDALGRRRMKKSVRICAISDVAIKVYRFASFVAVLSLEQALGERQASDTTAQTNLPPDVILKAVERSRMCVSTFSNFLTTNIHRSLKAAVEYTKGKAVKDIVLCNRQILQDGPPVAEKEAA